MHRVCPFKNSGRVDSHRLIVLPDMMPSRTKIRGSLLVLAVTLVLGFVVAELGVRQFQPVPLTKLLPFAQTRFIEPPTGAPESYGRFDVELGWSIGRSAQSVDDSILFQSNAGGFRADREYTIDPTPGVHRVAAFGDSFVHCDEVNY